MNAAERIAAERAKTVAAATAAIRDGRDADAAELHGQTLGLSYALGVLTGATRTVPHDDDYPPPKAWPA